MKQALVSLIRIVVQGRSEFVAAKAAGMSELSSYELHQVTGGPSVDLPRGTW